MLRVSLIGPGDINFHFHELLKFPIKKFQSELEKIAKALAESNVEIELCPDRGISFEIAKEYKKQGGTKVISSVPKSDKAYGIKHLEPYMKTKVNGKKLFDQEINTGDWKQQNRLKVLLGDIVLYLGTSPGTDLEANYGIYLFKLMNKLKKGIDSAKYLHPEVRAGKNIPYTFFIYSPFLKNKKLYSETENYMKKYRIKLIYIKNAKELKEKLSKL
jgi:hypothetical protein